MRGYVLQQVVHPPNCTRTGLKRRTNQRHMKQKQMKKEFAPADFDAVPGVHSGGMDPTRGGAPPEDFRLADDLFAMKQGYERTVDLTSVRKK